MKPQPVSRGAMIILTILRLLQSRSQLFFLLTTQLGRHTGSPVSMPPHVSPDTPGPVTSVAVRGFATVVLSAPADPRVVTRRAVTWDGTDSPQRIDRPGPMLVLSSMETYAMVAQGGKPRCFIASPGEGKPTDSINAELCR
ncbi:hypothetical protein F5Y14DRAFT_418088 [Nemania sp. NC0429]|nr:hypothetical protein F5Y14DRAFT_418088 [Nemania sp. NC0429]